MGDTAVVPIHGAIEHRADSFTYWFGGVGVNDLEEAIIALSANDSIKTIIFDIDSGGGQVDGIANLAARINSVDKEVIAVCNESCFSAAYWIASAADKIYLASRTAQIGSIGVVTAHIDVSGFEQKIGIKTTEIYAGKYKRIDSAYEPLSDDGRQYIQSRVDDLYKIFVDQVAENRGKSPKEILKMAEGQIFIGQNAIDTGIADAILSLEDLLITRFSGGNKETNTMAVNITSIFAGKNGKDKMKDDEEMEDDDENQAQEDEEMEDDDEAQDQEDDAEDDEEAEDEDDEASEEEEKPKSKKFNSSYRKGLRVGAARERKRIRAILEVAKSPQAEGYDNFITKALFNGKTTAKDLSYQIMCDHSQNRGVSMDQVRRGAKKVDNVKARKNKADKSKETINHMVAAMKKVGGEVN